MGISVKKSIIIGAGNTTHKLIKYMEGLGMDFASHFCVCLDNNPALWGTELRGVSIRPVEEVLDYPGMDIVVSSIYRKDICRQLGRLGINNPVIGPDDYRRQLFVGYQINNYNRTHPAGKGGSRPAIRELTVYTAIFGGYDTLREAAYPGKNVRYICFTDDRSLHSDTWEIRYMDREFEDPILECRKYKMLPHEFISAEYSLYIDANIQFKRPPMDYMNQYFHTGKMLFAPHEERDCIYKETAVCILDDRDLPQRLVQQANAYSQDNCPGHSGLYYGGIIGREHFDSETVVFDNEWWAHFKRYSRRDQISLGYLMWKKGIEVSLADIDIRNNSWFTIGQHIRNTSAYPEYGI